MKKSETKDLNPARETLPTEVAEAIEDVLWYLWEEARDGFIADGPGPGEGHIFRSLVAIDRWFYGHDEGPEEHVAGFLTDEERSAARERARSFRAGTSAGLGVARRRPYEINGTRCERCGSEGPFLLNPEDEFTVDEAGEIRFPEGAWGLDIDCDCPGCGFSARLGDFYEWVQVPPHE